MIWARRERPRASDRVVRSALWIVFWIASAAVVFVAVASVANYTSIVVARSTVYVVPEFAVSYSGLGSDGRLTPEGSVTVDVTARIENPSERTLRFYLVAYSGWIRDGPVEAGLNESRRLADDLLIGPEGEAWFYRVFGESSEVTLDPVLPRSNRAFTFTFTANAPTGAARFAVVRNITDFAIAQGGTAESVAWNQYLYVVLSIDGVPEPTSPTAPAYLRDIRRIERAVGVNIA
jgi:hypothetical protein